MIKQILKGVVIGIANIIPGVSGGTMAVSMGIYDKMIHCVNNIFKEFKKSVLFLLPIFIGAGLGIVGLTFVIGYMLDHFPIQTNLLFIGLILGGLPMIVKKVKGNAVRPAYLIAFLVFFAFVVAMAAIGEHDGSSRMLTVDFVSILKLFGVGIIASATMIIPGVSGSMVLMLLGYYNPIIDTINGFIKGALAFDMDAVFYGFGILAPFGIGIIVGILGIAKIIEIIFNKFPIHAYWAIIGLIAASPIAILLMTDLSSISVLAVLTGAVAFAAGWFIASKLGEE